jgi:hypothetical protein
LRCEIFYSSLRTMFGSGKRIQLASLCAAGALAALGCGPAKENYGCPTIDAVGGPLNTDNANGTTWNVTQACTVPYDRVSTADWCSNLLFDANGVRQVWLGHPALSFQGGFITFDGGGHYRSELRFATPADQPAKTNFTRACLNAYGVEPTCGDLQTKLTDYFSPKGVDDTSANIQSYRLQPITLLFQYPPDVLPLPHYGNFNCTDDGASGCDCSYSISFRVPDNGAYNADKTTIVSMISSTGALPYDNDFTADASSLMLTGHGGVDLFAQPGLRTLTFAKAPPPAPAP